MESTPKKNLFTQIIAYFLRGLILVAPLVITVWVILKTIFVIDDFVNDWIQPILANRIPGLGFFITILIILLIGFLATTYIMQYVIRLFELLFNQTRFTRWIYSSLKDLFDGFVSGKKRFEKAVLVKLNNETQVYKLGFITQENLEEIGIKDLVGVYVPHSYNISGDWYLVPKANLEVLENISSAQAMKLIVSGGMTRMDEESKNTTPDENATS